MDLTPTAEQEAIQASIRSFLESELPMSRVRAIAEGAPQELEAPWRRAGELGFFGLAYYIENQDKLKLVPVDDGKADNGAGAILPSPDTIRTGTYQPLSRPVFIYVSKKAAERAEVQQFVDFYLAEADALGREVNYVGLGREAYQLVAERFTARTPGSLFAGAENTVGVTIEQLLAKERGR